MPRSIGSDHCTMTTPDNLCFTRQLLGSGLIPMARLQLGFARQQSRHLKPHLQQRVPVVRNDDGPATG
jgi:hypothetical protein